MKELEDGKTKTDGSLFKILIDDELDGKYFNFEYLKLKFKIQNKISKITMVDNDGDLIGHKVFVIVDKNKNMIFFTFFKNRLKIQMYSSIFEIYEDESELKKFEDKFQEIYENFKTY